MSTDLGPMIIDIDGTDLSSEDREILLHPFIGGVILFSRNFKSREQLSNLTLKIKKINRNPSLLICVDQEGGRIQRFCKGFTKLPALKEFGELWKRPSSKEISISLLNSFNSGRILAKELLNVGVDFSFTPVLDLDWGRSKVIGNRSASNDPRVVFAVSKSLCCGLAAEGMKNCGKHFPGHGWATSDSHISEAIDTREFCEIEEFDLLPYRLLIKAQILDSIMPAHVTFSKIDSMPAGFSKFWLKEVLRKNLEFKGLIISDDLSMNAASVYKNITDRVMMSLEAGCDATLVCNDRQSVISGLDNLPKEFILNKKEKKYGNLKMLKPSY